ncbi:MULTISPECIES: DIP1984 family protein [Fusobacterium]|jgi:predicted translin family RNA/ssDNA-binding protein|uniref:DIP1984 family protein n=1 Tax=Fusobacterium TaxID=848 RepID=UPI000C70EBA6|nr:MULTISPECIES: DIP1984 family protein [Fusobacterium]
MKLAEALNLRADLKIRIKQLKERLIANSKVQEGDVPSENPEELLKELKGNLEQLEDLIKKINMTNSSTVVDGETLTDLIAKRDVLTMEISIKREFLASASEKINRYSNNEIKILSTIDVGKKQKEIDKLSKKLRELDTKIQGLNWTTELK